MFGNRYQINVEFEEVVDDVALSFPYISVFFTDELDEAQAFLHFIQSYYPKIEEPENSDFFDVHISIIDSEDDEMIDGYLVRTYEDRDSAFSDWKDIFTKIIEVREKFKM